MPYLSEIVNGINEGWKKDVFSCSPLCDCNYMFEGIGETILDKSKDDSQKDIHYPGIVDNYGEVKVLLLDDNKDFLIYHKLESILNNVDRAKAFGDSRGASIETANMAAVVLAWRDKVKYPAHQIEAFLKDSLPEQTRIKNTVGQVIQTSNLRVGNSSFEKLGLLAREYTEISLNYPLLMVFEMKYTIESTYKKGCLNPCS